MGTWLRTVEQDSTIAINTLRLHEIEPQQWPLPDWVSFLGKESGLENLRKIEVVVTDSKYGGFDYPFDEKPLLKHLEETRGQAL